MSPRPDQPEPFVRGVAYPAYGDVTYPRANPSDTARLPADIWHAAEVPVGVRLELVGDAEAIDIAYKTTTGNLGYRGDAAGITFSVWRTGHKVSEEEAVLGDGMVRLALGHIAADKPATVYLPEGMQPTILSVTPVNGDIEPAPAQPRWLAYGDSVTQGWIASNPSHAWTAIAARKAGLDVVNLGYAGAARGEIVSAEHLADLDADIITVSVGTNCWTRIPHSVEMVDAKMRAFFEIVRSGHPYVPVVVISPTIRPDAENTPNRLGATLADIRRAIETVTDDRIGAGDDGMALIEGGGVINEGHLADGIHPGDEGHKRIAAAVGKVLTASLKSAATRAAKRAEVGVATAEEPDGEDGDEAEGDEGDGTPEEHEPAAAG